MCGAIPPLPTIRLNDVVLSKKKKSTGKGKNCELSDSKHSQNVIYHSSWI